MIRTTTSLREAKAFANTALDLRVELKTAHMAAISFKNWTEEAADAVKDVAKASPKVDLSRRKPQPAGSRSLSEPRRKLLENYKTLKVSSLAFDVAEDINRAMLESFCDVAELPRNHEAAITVAEAVSKSRTTLNQVGGIQVGLPINNEDILRLLESCE